METNDRSNLLLGAIPLTLRTGGLYSQTVRTPSTGDQAAPYPSDSVRNPSLDRLLDHSGTTTFLQENWTKQFRYYSGSSGRFHDLMSWDTLNDLLELRACAGPRIQLAQNGKMLSTADLSLAKTGDDGSRNEGISATRVTRALRDGATLIINGINECVRPITALASDLEQIFHVPIQVNLYASWCSSPGFDVHWDGHEVIVLQIEGRKEWKIYGKTEDFPLQSDRKVRRQAPTSPISEQLVTDGDTLYIPRGWWHAAIPLNEPTLHLTIGIANRTGSDLLEWFIERLRSDIDVRRDLPLFESSDKRRAYMNKLQQSLTMNWSAELLDEFFAHQDATAQGDAAFSLPWSATCNFLPEDDREVQLHWIPVRSVQLRNNRKDGIFSIACNGTRWLFTLSAAPILTQLMSRRRCTLEDLCSLAGQTGLSAATIRCFMAELIAGGLVAIRTHEMQPTIAAEEPTAAV